MRTLYLDCGMGAAGDMLTAALSELLPDQDAFFEKMHLESREFILRKKKRKNAVLQEHTVR